VVCLGEVSWEGVDSCGDVAKRDLSVLPDV
jgi:hypothetical protein